MSDTRTSNGGQRIYNLTLYRLLVTSLSDAPHVPLSDPRRQL